jgi:hypothetical protein
MNWAMKIRHPDWLPSALKSVESSIELAKADRLPSAIKGSMLAIPCHRLLRTIYGGNFKIAWVFFCCGCSDVWRRIQGKCWRFWHYRVLLRSPEVELNKLTGKIEDDEEGE